jgi:hypothetical protein
MTTYREQVAEIERIKIREGERRTMDCPWCGGKNKFTIDRLIDGRLVWNCYRASCDVKGVKNIGRSISSAKSYLNGDGQSERRKAPPLPAITTKVENSSDAIRYLKSVNSLEAYENGLIDIRFDPRTRRVLFYNQDHTGAVGRALGGGIKWMTYGDCSNGIHVGDSSIAVLVEDVPSACSVSRLRQYTGVALLGTTITSALKNALLVYKFVYIILDSDASKKSVSLSKRLRGSTYVRITTKDLKELTMGEIAGLLRAQGKTDQQ